MDRTATTGPAVVPATNAKLEWIIGHSMLAAVAAGCFPSSYTSIHTTEAHTPTWPECGHLPMQITKYSFFISCEKNCWSGLRRDNGNVQPLGFLFPHVLHAMLAVFQSHESEQALIFQQAFSGLQLLPSLCP